MKKQISEETALGRVAALCSGSEHCEAEVRAKLDAWGIDDEAQNRIVAYLYKVRFLDENRYANFFAHDKLRYNQWGRTKIRMALRQKQISSEAIDEALENLDEDEYLGILQQLIKAKKKSVKGKNDYECRCKLIKFAMSRGFEYAYIQRFIEGGDEEDAFADDF